MLDFLGECENMILKVIDSKQEASWKHILKKVLDYHSKEIKLFLKTLNKPLYEHQDTMTER